MKNIKLILVLVILFNTAVKGQQWNFSGGYYSTPIHIGDINKYPSMKCNVTSSGQRTWNCWNSQEKANCGSSPCEYRSSDQNMGMGASYNCRTTVTTTSIGLKDCNNNCNMTNIYLLGNGTCNDSSPNFRCAELGWDDGDCDPIVYHCGDQKYVESINPPEGFTHDQSKCKTIKVPGCKDNPDAINYDAEYNVDDGSCVAPVYFCDNEITIANSLKTYIEGLSENVPPGANSHKDSHCITEVIEGCTDPKACSYDPVNPANLDGGNCITDAGSIDGSFTAVWDNSSQKVKLSWDNNCNNPEIDDYVIYKRLKGSNSWDEILLNNACSGLSSNVPQIEQSRQYYLDIVNFSMSNQCPSYEYYIKTLKCSKHEKQTSIKEVQVNLSLGDTWDENNGKSLTVTTGDYENRVELFWENNNSAVINNFGIYRRQYNPKINTQYTLIGETSNDVHHFIDYNVEPYVLYQYYINAVVPSCESTGANNIDQNAKHVSNSKIGFRTPLVDIYGQVVYDEGAGVVEDTDLSGSPINPSINKSLSISSLNNSLVLPEVNSDFSLMAWYNFPQSDGSEKTILSGFSDTQNFINISSDNKIQFNGIEYGGKLRGWRHIAITYNQSNSLLIIYVDGLKIQEIYTNLSVNSSLIVCEEFNGLLDEISFWNISLSENFIKNNFDKYLKYDTPGLLAYYHCDEGLGNYIYDSSIGEDNSQNKNHLKLNSSLNNFNSESTSDHVSYHGVTDENGYYSIEEVRFGKNGTNFEVIPRKVNALTNTPHEFSPNKLGTYIGNGVESLANFNFNDESSFRFSGSVYYLDPSINDSLLCTYSTSSNYTTQFLLSCETDIPHPIHTNNSNFGVSGVKILIDGKEVYGKDGNIEQTDAYGNFDIEVPIGLHEITIEKDGHTFVNYKWDTDQHITIDNSRLYNFVRDVSGIDFYDNTKRTLIGKVCGGVFEESRLLDSASTNNIGEASFYLSNNSDKHKVQINTDFHTGEYSVNLLPISYNVELDDNYNRISVVDNDAATDYFKYWYSFAPIDLSSEGDVSNNYDKIKNFVFRTSPHIYIHNTVYTDSISNQNHLKLGESEWSILNQEFNESTQEWESQPSIIIPLFDNSGDNFFTYPIFKKGVQYEIITRVFEPYVNYQTGISFDEPVTLGTLTFSTDNNSQSFEVNDVNTIIPFIPNDINTSLGANNSFLKNLTVAYANGNIRNEKNVNYYVFGSQVDEGLNFFSSGPEVVEMVLRDPPGDLSYSYIESGSSHKNNVEIYSSGDVISNHLQKDVNLGTKLQFSIPFGGPILTTELIANTQVDIEFESVIDNTEETSYEASYGESYRTSNSQFNIGSGGDLYISNNYNLVYGTNNNLEIIDKDICKNQGIICLGENSDNPSDFGEDAGAKLLFLSDNGVEYTIGTSVGLEIVPTGFKTKTVYDQNHILNNLIPTLKWIRNTYFGLAQVYQRIDTDLDNPCYDNLTHPLYDAVDNPEPCYVYNQNADLSDPYVLPFNLFEDINIADYIPNEFISLIESELIKSQQNGYTGFSDASLKTIDSFLQTSNTGGNALDAIDNILDSQFWTDFAGILGAQNLLLGVNAFKSEVIDFYSDQLQDFDEGMNQLKSVLANMQHTVPNDKVKFYNQQIRLWEQAILENEIDKASIFENDYSESTFNSNIENNLTYGPDQNYSFSAGNNIEESYRITNNTSNLKTISYTIDGEIAYEIGGRIQGFGGSYQDVIPITFGVEKNITETEEDYIGFGYVLSDDDESDYLTVDVKNSNKGWGPIFRKRAGQTMCPHETEEPFIFHQISDSESNLFSPATQPREVPKIQVSPLIIQGVPESEPAVFNLTLINNSVSKEDIVYTIMVDEASNPYGAILNIDGQAVYREIMVPYGESINKTLTVHKGPNQLFYTDSSDEDGEDNRLSIILRSSCQYSYGNSNTPDIADTVSFGVTFLPGCTDVSISQPIDNWILNQSSERISNSGSTNNLTIKLEDYDYNYYSLDNIILEYKESTASELEYDQIRNFKKLENGDTLESNEQTLDLSNVTYHWDMQGIDDGDYDIRAYSDCGGIRTYSDVISGHKDTRIPKPFGSPQPADGILSANDEILLNWSEAIDQSEFYSTRTDIRMNAILNNSITSNDAYIYIDSESLLEIPSGINLKGKSFTIEMWIDPSSPGTLIKQGHENNQLRISIDDNHKLVANYEVSNQVISSSSTSLINVTNVSDTWQHIAFVFDNDLKTISYVINGSLTNSDVSPFLIDYIGEGPMYIGDDGFEGGIHNLRVWSTLKKDDAIDLNRSKRLIGNENGLLGYWPMDELSGSAKDLARMRDISSNINWSVSQKGYGYNFSGNNFIHMPMNEIIYESADDFTIEFWFKTTGTNQCILSTGSNDNLSEIGNSDFWSIIVDENGYIQVEHNTNNSSNTPLLSSQEIYNDNIWHHLALVKNGKSNTTLFIDNIEQAITPSTNTRGLSGSQLTLGANFLDVDNEVNYFEGKVDEFRVWGLNRNLSQLNRYKNIRHTGSELGLDVYLPFEMYQGTTSIISHSNIDLSSNVNAFDDINGFSFESMDLPLIRMSNPYVSLDFEALVNQDQILLNINNSLNEVEGVIVDVSIDNIYDLYSNKANPVSWSFYVDRNQLVWDENQIEVDKVLGKELIVDAMIINHSGSIDNFEITNIPSWLSVVPTSGTIEPNSILDVEMTIDPSLFIGNYNRNLKLSGSNDVSEILNLDVNIKADPPEISVNPENFEFDMNFIGKVSVDGIRSRDESDILIAYIDNEPRGISSLIYIEEYDAYYVFMTVYSNNQFGDEIYFSLWDASEGKVQSKVTIDSEETITFYDGSLVGSMFNLTAFDANNTLFQKIELLEGWNWCSFNLLNNKYSLNPNKINIPIVTSEVNSSEVEVIKGINSFALYGDQYGWLGSLDAFTLGSMYKIKINEPDTLIYEGTPVDLTNPLYHINISDGWNWIGYLGQRPLEINHALSSINPNPGDLIKNKTSFSQYASESIGWVGTLDFLSENEGYMFKSSESHTLIYPESSLLGSNSYRERKDNSHDNIWGLNVNKYENSMNIVAIVDDNNSFNQNSDDVIGAFINSECIGQTNQIKVGEKNYYFITVNGNEQDSISFKYFDKETDLTYESLDKIIFEKDNITGDYNTPYIISFDGNTDDSINFNLYPNPYEDSFNISFNLYQDDEIEINMYDVMGRLVKTLYKGLIESGSQELLFDSNELNKGYYFIEINIDEKIYTKSIIKS